MMQINRFANYKICSCVYFFPVLEISLKITLCDNFSLVCVSHLAKGRIKRRLGGRNGQKKDLLTL